MILILITQNRYRQRALTEEVGGVELHREGHAVVDLHAAVARPVVVEPERIQPSPLSLFRLRFTRFQDRGYLSTQ
jgi:hypothetical protein